MTRASWRTTSPTSSQDAERKPAAGIRATAPRAAARARRARARARRHNGRSGADAGHDHQHRRERRATWCTAGADVAVLEAMKMEHLSPPPCRRRVRRDRRRAGRRARRGRAVRSSSSRPSSDRRGEAAEERSILDRIRADLAEVHRAPRASASTRTGPTPSRAARKTEPAHRARKHRRLCRPGHLHRVRRAGDRRAAPPPHARGSDRATRRPTAWSPASARSTATASTTQGALRRDGLRLHRAGRHAGRAEPSEERPHVRARRAAAAAGRLFAEGGGGRPGDTDGSASPASTCRRSAHFAKLSADSCRWSASTRAAASPATPRCSAAATSSSRPRNSNIGMGGPAMIEGGGLGVFTPGGSRPDRRCRCANGVVDIAVADEAEAVRVAKQISLLLPGRRSASGTAPTSACCATRSRRTGCASTTCARSSRRSPTRTRCSNCARDFGLGMVTALDPHRGPAGRASSPTTRCIWRRDRQPTAPTRPRASCSCATRSTCRCCSCATRPGFMVGPEVEKTALVRHACAHVRRPARSISVPFFTSSCARAMASARRRWRAAASRRRCSPSPGRPASSAAWGSKARCRLGYRKELEAVDDPPKRRGAVRGDGGAVYEHGKAINMRRALRDRRRDRSGRHAALDHAGLPLDPAARPERKPPDVYRYVVISRPRAFAACCLHACRDSAHAIPARTC